MAMTMKAYSPPEELLHAVREIGVSPERAKRRQKILLAVLTFCCLSLVPYIGYLAVVMPGGYEARAWPAAWVGFDIFLLAALAGTAICALLRRQAVIILAVVSITLLVCDAWFDIMLAWGSPDVWGSAAEAVFVELPLAAFLASWVRALLQAALRLRWKQLGLAGDAPSLLQWPLLFLAVPAAAKADADGTVDGTADSAADAEPASTACLIPAPVLTQDSAPVSA